MTGCSDLSFAVFVTVHVTLGTFWWNAAEHLALEVFDDLRTPLLPPRSAVSLSGRSSA